MLPVLGLGRVKYWERSVDQQQQSTTCHGCQTSIHLMVEALTAAPSSDVAGRHYGDHGNKL